MKSDTWTVELGRILVPSLTEIYVQSMQEAVSTLPKDAEIKKATSAINVIEEINSSVSIGSVEVNSTSNKVPTVSTPNKPSEIPAVSKPSKVPVDSQQTSNQQNSNMHEIIPALESERSVSITGVFVYPCTLR